MASEETRSKLLRAALEVFAAKGFSGARVDEIARRAKANKAMIYYHFGAKKALYQAVLLSIFSMARERMLAAVASVDDDPARRLSAIYGVLATAFREEPALPCLILREIMAGGRNMDDEAAHALGSVFQLVRAAIEDGQRAGQFRNLPPLLVHLNIVGTLLLYFGGAAFRERIVAANPGLTPPSAGDVAGYVNDVLARVLPPDAGPIRS